MRLTYSKYSLNRGVQKIKTKTAIMLSVIGLALSGGTGLSVLAFSSAHAAALCTPTGFMKDNINLTAAQIGGDVTGTLDATGCNIGVYYGPGNTGTVTKADVFGANYFGVVNDGGNVIVDKSAIHNIGETPQNGSQHGIGVYYTNAAQGDIANDSVSTYQKGGIVVNGEGTKANVHNNTVTGAGPVDYIAQNGIQVSRGAQSDVHNNTVTGNAYTGQNDASSAGILVFGGWGTPLVTGSKVHNNTLDGNDVGIYLANYNSDASGGPDTATKIDVHNNDIANAAITNVSGNGYPMGYQAGISDSGNQDTIHNNKVSGDGYAPTDTANAYVRPIDLNTAYSVNPKVHKNTFDGSPYNG